MTDLEKRIYELIAQSNGIDSAEIALSLGVEKKNVNIMLSHSAELKAHVRQEADFKWYLKATKKIVEKPLPKPDNDLHNICMYYLQCISLESSSSVSQYLDGGTSKEYAVLNSLEIDAVEETEAIRLLGRISADKDKKAYLGYPIRIYSILGKNGKMNKKIAPVFLFPMEYAGGAVTVSTQPSINMDVLKGYCDGGTGSLVNELVALETELGMNEPDSEIETDELVLRLIRIRDWEWREEINPYEIPKQRDISVLPNGIYNQPIIISAQKGKYTDGLESELMMLAQMPEQDFKETALHAWIKNCVSPPAVGPDMGQILEVLPLNTEQSLAIETAMRSDLTIITGPPGTGKSQVVTDLLANIAWHGKSALFSSKNHKAVDVVDLRVNSLSASPSLLRIGNNQYASRLVEIVENFLSFSGTPQDQSDLQFLQQEYNELITRENKLKERKTQLMQDRNRLDEAEKEYCPFRDVMDAFFLTLPESDSGQILKSARAYIATEKRTSKENNGVFSRLLWGRMEPKRQAARDMAENCYNAFASRYGLPEAGKDRSEKHIQSILVAAESFEGAIPATLAYRRALVASHNSEKLEDIDRELLDIEGKRACIAQNLWDKWLRVKNGSISQNDRWSLGNGLSAMKLMINSGLKEEPKLRKQYSQMIRLMKKHLPCWAVTSLSVKSSIPFEKHRFDYVIIDEASQCDIASILPLLYRAKRAVIIGDPKQLQHIATLPKNQDVALLSKYKIDLMWSYSANSLYSLAAALVSQDSVIQLKDHFRSCADIIEFSNKEFYDGTLRTATNYTSLKTPPEEEPGIRWINVSGNTVRPTNGSAYNVEEISQVVRELERIVQTGYAGTIGVTTPFRRQAELIERAVQKNTDLYNKLKWNHEFLADTVHKFQGDERDLMLFSSVITDSATPGAISFLFNTGNLFNVAITRARSSLVVVGDYQYCSKCGVRYLEKFAEYYSKLSQRDTLNANEQNSDVSREYPWVANPEQVSEWEKILYTALFDVGIHTSPQYPADRYKLDLAVTLPNGKKLDIEVDGERYHRSWNGELCYRDQLRNQRLFELGWDVQRFWVYQIRDDIDWCVQKVKDWCSDAQYGD